ncbi:uncharacterized protein LOC127277873 [Leptopilina boulardi]|uniref:uncharacterized protein LOC127277873 n=1 Tax=Leptopilina boulardi TaxID=63433 RepID=UPI0021F5A975|nr:uncharacterized protein LOC127277873 [Leptopilina boulardi]
MVNVNHVSKTDKNEVFNLNKHDNEIVSTLLATALVEVEVDNGKLQKFKVLLDQGSESCFVSERAVRTLNPRFEKINALTVRALVLPRLTAYHPPAKPKNYNEIKTFSLADPNLFEDSPIDFILGADKLGSCLLPGLKQGIAGILTAQSTIFGWVLSGPIHGISSSLMYSPSVHNSVSIETLHDNLEKFWQLEELPTTSSLTEEQKNCEQHFIDTHQRLVTGRYMVRLPFQERPPINIGSSLTKCRIVLNRVLQRLSKDPAHLEQYKAFMGEYESLGHMRLTKIEDSSDRKQIVYLPHHCVVRESSSTTKLRVVFNASSLTSNNTSLNCHLHIGPPLSNNLVSILLRWREHKYVYIADVEKMFRQILIDPRDLDYQRILWKNDREELVAYQLLTVTYGTSCAPYLANRVIRQLIID